MELRGSCNGCGACCKVLVLEQSPEEVRQMAALTRVLGIPSDHIFAAEHWRPLTREEATALNPFYTSRLPVVRPAAARDAARRPGVRLRGRPAGLPRVTCPVPAALDWGSSLTGPP